MPLIALLACLAFAGIIGTLIGVSIAKLTTKGPSI